MPINSNFNNQNTYTVKGDHYFNAKHHLSLSNVYAGNPFYSAGIFPVPIETGYGPIRTYTFDFARLTEDWVITPTLLNQFRIGYNRQTQYSRSSTINGGWPAKLGMQGLSNPLDYIPSDFPTINDGSFSTLAGHNYTYPVSNTGVLFRCFDMDKGPPCLEVRI